MKYLSIILFSLLLNACFDSSSSADNPQALICELNSSHISFFDEDPAPGFISGDIHIQLPTNCDTQSIKALWLNTSTNSKRNTEPYTLTTVTSDTQSYAINIPKNTKAPSENETLSVEISVNNDVPFEIIDNAHVKGPGGSEKKQWYYGTDRPPLQLTAQIRGDQTFCIFDNGKVLIHDFNYDDDLDLSGKRSADDVLYPAFEFNCTDTTVNEHRKITTLGDNDEELIESYSMINDAMFYGTLVYDMYEELLGKPPMDKIRIRTHFGDQSNFNLWAHWDGAYVNFNDVIHEALGGSTSLDTVAHEITHGVLNKHTPLVFVSEAEYSHDARTLHEGFSDMASVMAHYYLHNELNWIIGDENDPAAKRYLDKIKTEYGAIDSYFDYADAGNNFYRRMGMITYPFYLLTNKWGIEPAFKLFLSAAQSCWFPDSSLLQAAQCVHATSNSENYNHEDVIAAFRQVKIQLEDEDTLAHFTIDQKKLRTQFSDNSHTDRSMTEYHWDFGDGNQSIQASPYHEYATAGSYAPTLTVTDSSGIDNTFTRNINITDQYCTPSRSNNLYREFTGASINDSDIGYILGIYDYSNRSINVTAGTDFPVVINGNVLGDNKPDTIWEAWVDFNDDGVFDHRNETSESILVFKQTDKYGLNTKMNIPGEYAGKTLYMRIESHPFSIFDPCSSPIKSVIDIKLHVL